MTHHQHSEPEHLCGCQAAILQDRIEDLEVAGTSWCTPLCRGRSKVTYRRDAEWLLIECPAGHIESVRTYP